MFNNIRMSLAKSRLWKLLQDKDLISSKYKLQGKNQERGVEVGPIN